MAYLGDQSLKFFQYLYDYTDFKFIFGKEISKYQLIVVHFKLHQHLELPFYP